MKITMYGAEICPDCVKSKRSLSALKRIELEYKNIIGDTATLKEFLAYRDNDTIFREIKDSGRIGIPFFIFAYLAIIHAEENFLGKTFGQEFKDYCKRVNRIIPNFSGIGNTIKGMEFNWKRLIVKEYATPFAWIAGLTLLIIKETYLDHGYEASKYTLWSLSILFLVVTCAFFTAWYLKKNKLLRSN